MHVYFGDRVIPAFGIVSKSEAERELSFSWEANPGALHAVVVYPQSGKAPPVFAAVNVPDADLTKGDTIVPYRGITEAGTYAVDLLLQPRELRGVREDDLPDALRGAELLCVTEFRVGPQVRSRGGVKTPKEEGEAFCRCVLHVAARQPRGCLHGSQRIGRQVNGQTCYNPYAVCTTSTGRPRRCEDYWTPERLQKLPDDELEAYAALRKIPVPKPFDREELMSAVEKWRGEKGY
jgi:hypothetical protein